MLCLAACAQQSGLPVPSRSLTSADCPRLDSQLAQLVAAADRAQFASGAAIDVNASGARVLIELAQGADVPPNHAISVEARQDRVIQARVPIDDLCPLSREPTVVSVTVPTRFVPQTSGP